jgi:hypothetical protein
VRAGSQLGWCGVASGDEVVNEYAKAMRGKLGNVANL